MKRSLTKIHLLNPQKQYRLPLKRLRQQLNQLSRFEPLTHSEITFIFLDEKAMASLNWHFLKHRGTTDVITFQHGEIFICPAVAYDESQRRRLSFSHEIALYAIHGWLHLRGFQDKTPAQSRLMQLYQNQLLEKLI